MNKSISEFIPEKFHEYLDSDNKRDGFIHLVKQLPETYSFKDISEEDSDSLAQKTWEAIGLHFSNPLEIDKGRVFESRLIFVALYEHMLRAQQQLGIRIHKGMPLLWIAESFGVQDLAVLRKRYLMLALCEDAIRGQGIIDPNNTGVYFRLVWRLGMSDEMLRKYAKCCFDIANRDILASRFPEWVVSQLDQDWMTEFPTPAEANFYISNPVYAKLLLEKLGSTKGQALEDLAEYLMLCMPGCRVKKRRVSHSTDYDLICSMEGFDVDFRSELGRYFVCECKDWKRKANFSSFAKFCRVLDSVKSKFGIMFSKNGITSHAEREQLKVFQDRGVVIIVIDETDLNEIISGVNFVNLLRKKYERVRLDLREPKSGVKSRNLKS